MLSLLAEANEKYGEYKITLEKSKFDSKYFLNSIILGESFKSTQIEGTRLSQDEMYYLKYMKKNDETTEIQNLKRVIEYLKEYMKDNNDINLTFLNSCHKILLNSVRGNNKQPGEIRSI